jgi:hypothetical protein
VLIVTLVAVSSALPCSFLFYRSVFRRRRHIRQPPPPPPHALQLLCRRPSELITPCAFLPSSVSRRRLLRHQPHVLIRAVIRRKKLCGLSPVRRLCLFVSSASATGHLLRLATCGRLIVGTLGVDHPRALPSSSLVIAVVAVRPPPRPPATFSPSRRHPLGDPHPCSAFLSSFFLLLSFPPPPPPTTFAPPPPTVVGQRRSITRARLCL